MEVRFANRQEHAMLALIVKTAFEKRGSGNNRGIGRTALQKIAYFLSVLGVPMRYRFSIYTYGPFCSDILSDTELLEFDGAVRDGSSDSGTSSYSPGDQIDRLLTEHKEFIDAHGDTIKMVASGLAAAAPSILELYSTTDYVYRWLSTELKRMPMADEVYARVEELKSGKFTPAQKRGAFEWLQKVGLIGESKVA